MKHSKEKILPYLVPVLTGSVIAIVGAVLLFKPGTSLVGICYILGVAVLIKGLLKIIEGKRFGDTGALLSGAVTLVLSALLFLHPRFLLSIFPVITGLVILGYGIISFLLRSAESTVRKITAVLTAIAGLVVIIVPLKFAKAVTAVTGLALILLGILVIAVTFADKKEIQPPTVSEDGYTEVEFKDVDK